MKHKITILLTDKEFYHLSSPHSFIKECECACNVLNKIQDQIDKKVNSKKVRWNE